MIEVDVLSWHRHLNGAPLKKGGIIMALPGTLEQKIDFLIISSNLQEAYTNFLAQSSPQSEEELPPRMTKNDFFLTLRQILSDEDEINLKKDPNNSYRWLINGKSAVPRNSKDHRKSIKCRGDLAKLKTFGWFRIDKENFNDADFFIFAITNAEDLTLTAIILSAQETQKLFDNTDGNSDSKFLYIGLDSKGNPVEAREDPSNPVVLKTKVFSN